MKNIISSLLIFSTTIVFLNAQQNFNDLRLSLETNMTDLSYKVKDTLKYTDKSFNKSFDKFVNSLEKLLTEASEVYQKKEPDTLFIQNLEDMNIKLEQLMGVSDKAYLVSYMDIMSADLKLKLSSPMGLSSVDFVPIRLFVKTKKNNAYIDGYTVKGNYAWDFNAVDARFNFSLLTNNAYYDFTPGKYIIWVEKSGEAILKKNVDIGYKNGQEEIVEFDIP